MQYKAPVFDVMKGLAALRHRLVREVEGRLPIGVDLWLKSRRGYTVPPAEPLDVTPLSLIHEATDDELASPRAMIDIVERLGLSGNQPGYFPERLKPNVGLGLRVWQYPIQYGPYLCEIGQRGIESYLEVGTQHGGTFCLTVSYLRRRGPLRQADAVDFQYAPAIRQLEDRSIRAHRMNSASPRFRRLVQDLAPLDLAFIDGDHSEIGCMLDFRAVEQHARMVAFHDISDPRWGVRSIWKTLRTTHAKDWDFLEFEQQYPEIEKRVGHPVLGIGLMARR